MCKIMAFAGIKPEKAAEAEKFIQRAAEELSSATDKDGFGYAGMDKSGTIYGERWLNPRNAFKERDSMTNEEKETMTKFGTAVVRSREQYNFFGNRDHTNTVAYLLHARFSTNTVCIENTHPFVVEDKNGDQLALIHNGVISNTKTLKNYTSSCDSECILNSYSDAAIDMQPDNVQSVVDELRGSFAVAVMGRDGAGVPYLDIFKNDRASLVMVKIKELDCLVFCTTLQIVETVARFLNYTLEYNFWVTPGHLIRLNAETGDIMSITGFDYEQDKKGAAGGGTVSNFPERPGHYQRTAAGWAHEPFDDNEITEADIKALLERDPHYSGYTG